MKIMVISDSHGQTQEIIETINSIEGIDLLIHLGDYIKDATEIQSITKLDMISVSGNCDIFGDNLEEDKVIEILGKKIFITHGHRYSVKYGLESLYFKAKELGASIVLFGHSHVPVSTMYEGIIFLNPGSTTIPRGRSKKSYGIIEIGEKIIPRIVEM